VRFDQDVIRKWSLIDFITPVELYLLTIFRRFQGRCSSCSLCRLLLLLPTSVGGFLFVRFGACLHYFFCAILAENPAATIVAAAGAVSKGVALVVLGFFTVPENEIGD
jgi:hypothetical protein